MSPATLAPSTASPSTSLAMVLLWARDHLDPRRPRSYTLPEARFVAAEAGRLEGRDRNTAFDALMYGFPVDLLPPRVPVRRFLRAAWWPESDRVEAYDVGGARCEYGYARPLLTLAALAHLVEVEQRSIDVRGRMSKAKAMVYTHGDGIYLCRRCSGAFVLELCADHTTPSGDDLYDLRQADLCWGWDD